MNITSAFHKKFLLYSILVAGLMVISPTYAEGSDAWTNTFNLYLLGPTLDGTVGIGPADGDVDMNAGDVFSMLDKAFLGVYAGEGERWGVMADVIYMDLSEDDISGPLGRLTGEVGNKQLIALGSISYRVTDNWRLLLGLMYTDITADILIEGPLETRYRKTSESWADPVAGVLFNAPISANWEFTGMAQIGGGVGADLVYSMTAAVVWNFGKKTSASLGYRYLDFDYEDGKGLQRFKFDMKQHGPALGLRFRW